MNILITGGAGFIGTNTARFFAGKKHRITVVDDFSRPGVEKNASWLADNCPRIEIIKSDVNDIAAYLRKLKQADAVIHLAGQTAVTTSIADPLNDFRINLQGGFTLLEAVRKHNPAAVMIYASTNKVYGDLGRARYSRRTGVDESAPLDFISPYGCSKGAIDQYFLDYGRIYGLRTVVFRQSCIYGPFQIGIEDQGWVAHFGKQFLTGNPITIFGNGRQVRDLLFVEDLVKAYALAIRNSRMVSGEAVNIGGGTANAYNLLQVMRLMKKCTGKSVKTVFAEKRSGDQDYFVSANKKAKRLLGWQPSTDFPTGLNKMLDWQQKYLVNGY